MLDQTDTAIEGADGEESKVGYEDAEVDSEQEEEEEPPPPTTEEACSDGLISLRWGYPFDSMKM